MTDDRIVVGFFDTVSDGDQFLAGTIQWSLFVRQQQERTTPQFLTARLAESLYFDPVSMADDLLRPYAHVIVGWDARPQLRRLARESAGPVPGPFLYNPTAPEVVAVARHLRTYTDTVDRVRYPLVRIEAPPIENPVGRFASWLAKLFARLLDDEVLDQAEELQIQAYLKRHVRYSRLRTPGAVGLKTDAHDIEEMLAARCFDPLQWMEETAGASAETTCELDWLREGLDGPNGPPPPFTLEDGSPITPAKLAELWKRSNVWRVIEASTWRLNLLHQILHTGLYGYVSTNRLDGPAAQLWTNRFDHALWRYAIDTHSWWNALALRGERK